MWILHSGLPKRVWNRSGFRMGSRIRFSTLFPSIWSTTNHGNASKELAGKQAQIHWFLSTPVVLKIWGRRQSGAPLGKTPHSEKSIAKHSGKPHFGNMAKSRAVRKGGLLRGKVSQGRPHPLRHSVKCVKVRPWKKKKKNLSVKLSVFVFSSRALAWRCKTLWLVWHAVEGRAEPCRGAFTGCRLCRRPLGFD